MLKPLISIRFVINTYMSVIAAAEYIVHVQENQNSDLEVGMESICQAGGITIMFAP